MGTLRKTPPGSPGTRRAGTRRGSYSRVDGDTLLPDADATSGIFSVMLSSTG